MIGIARESSELAMTDARWHGLEQGVTVPPSLGASLKHPMIYISDGVRR